MQMIFGINTVVFFLLEINIVLFVQSKDRTKTIVVRNGFFEDFVLLLSYRPCENPKTEMRSWNGSLNERTGGR